MSRIFKVLLSFCLVFCLLPSQAFAANTTYELDELADEMLVQRRTIGIVFILVLIVLAIICVFAVQKRRSGKGSIEGSVHITDSAHNEEDNQNETFLSGNIQEAIHILLLSYQKVPVEKHC